MTYYDTYPLYAIEMNLILNTKLEALTNDNTYLIHDNISNPHENINALM